MLEFDQKGFDQNMAGITGALKTTNSRVVRSMAFKAKDLTLADLGSKIDKASPFTMRRDEYQASQAKIVGDDMVSEFAVAPDQSNCRVPAENLVGGENRGVSIVMSGLDLERAMIAPAVPRRRRTRARTLHRLCQDAPAIRQADRLVPNGAVDARRHVCAGGDHADLHLSHAGRSRPARNRRWRSRRRSQADGSIGDVRGGCLPQGTRSRRTGAWRQRYIWESEINRLFRSTKLLEIGAGTTEVRKMIIAGELLKGA